MGSQYVFEIKFKGGTLAGTEGDTQFVIIDGSSMENLSSLMKDLEKLTSDHFLVRYIDDDEDVISIDSQEEFKEFAKLAKQRSSMGLLVRLILELQQPTKKKITDSGKKGKEAKESRKLNHPPNLYFDGKDIETSVRFKFTEGVKSKIISDLKKEILSEMKESMVGGAFGYTFEDEYEEDTDKKLFNNVSEMRKTKCRFQKEKKGEPSEHCLENVFVRGQLEKIEMRKYKLIQKLFTSNTGLLVPQGTPQPSIMSGIASNVETYLCRVSPGKSFLQVWTVFNDGTLPWKNVVELRHMWSSPGLEPTVSRVKCPPLLPNKSGQVVIQMKAPQTSGQFMSYWQFYYEVDSQWQQFGHYLSIQGVVKPQTLSESTGETTEMIQSSKRNSRMSEYSRGKAEQITSFKADKRPNNAFEEPRTGLQLKKNAEAHLASAEIAADMAREAANAAFRNLICNRPSTSSTQSPVEECIVPDMLKLNLSDSDSDINNEDEHSDAEYVFLDKPLGAMSNSMLSDNTPSGTLSENSIISDRAEHRGMKMIVNTKEEESSIKPSGAQLTIPTRVESIGEKVSDTMTPPAKKKKKDFMGANNRVLDSNNRVLDSNNCVLDSNNPAFNSNYLVLDSNNPVIDSNNPVIDSNNPVIDSNNPVIDSNNPVLDSNMHVRNADVRQPNPHRPLPPFPRLDPRVNYPVFPPVVRPGFAEQNPLTTMAPRQYPYQNIPHQTSFPQPPIQMVQFPLQKVNTPNYVAQLPTYPLLPQYPLWQPAEHNPNNMAPNQTMWPQFTRPNATSTASHLQNTQAGCLPYDTAYQRYAASNQALNMPTVNKHPEPPALAIASFTAIPSTKTNIQENMASSDLKTDKHVGDKNVQPEMTPVATVDTNKKSESVVQILPQALVDGAITVASTAYSTAWNALNNLRTTEEKEAEFDPVFENNMALLVEMGFNNLERNARLLKRFNNDISQVIGVICATGGAHNLDID